MTLILPLKKVKEDNSVCLIPHIKTVYSINLSYLSIYLSIKTLSNSIKTVYSDKLDFLI